jgi:hypothetical protein
MNIRELINRLDTIDTIKEGITLQDVQAAADGKSNEQDRAKALMTLAANNGLPGLYDPVSGYYVSAIPDTSNWPDQKARISATASKDDDAKLAGLGLIPAKANTSTALGRMFGSSDEKYAANIKNTSDKVVANQTSTRVNGENLKKLNDLVAQLEKSIPTATTAMSAPAPGAGAKVKKESINIEAQLLESFGLAQEGSAVANAIGGAAVGTGIVAHNVLKSPEGEEPGFWTNEIIPGIPYSRLDIAIDLGFIAAGFAVGALGGPAGEGAALLANLPRIKKIADIITKAFAVINPIERLAVKGKKGVEIVRTAVKKFGDSVQWSLFFNTLTNLLKDVKVLEGLTVAEQMQIMNTQLRLLDEITLDESLDENWLTNLFTAGEKSAAKTSGKKVLQLTYDDLMTIDGKNLIREIPDTYKQKIIDWLKANPGKTIGAAIAALGIADKQLTLNKTSLTAPLANIEKPAPGAAAEMKWPTTPEEIRAFQRTHDDPRVPGSKLVADGVIGSHTYQALIASGAKPPAGFTVTPYGAPATKPTPDKGAKPTEPTAVEPTPEQTELIKQINQIRYQLSDVGDDAAVAQALQHAQEVLGKFGNKAVYTNE